MIKIASMNYKFLLLFLSMTIISCSSKKQLIYLNDIEGKYDSKYISINSNENNFNLEAGDVLKIDVNSIQSDASIVFNSNKNQQSNVNNIDLLILDGFLIDEDLTINYPILGKINVEGMNESDLEYEITKRLVNEGHLLNPIVNVRRLNSKFTVLGEVSKPGTFSFYENKINIFQALGYAGDLTINGKRNNITLIREKNGLSNIYKISLRNSELINQPYFYVKNNDVIIVNPNFSKVKSAGFVGSPSSLASISSLILSITLLIINN